MSFMRSKINSGSTTVYFNHIRIAEKGIFKQTADQDRVNDITFKAKFINQVQKMIKKDFRTELEAYFHNAQTSIFPSIVTVTLFFISFY